MAKTPPFARESDLCGAFIKAVGEERWTAYAETGGFDILLVRKTDGFQIGIQAKLKLNASVLAQSVEESRYCADRPGPDCRAILVPITECNLGMGFLAGYIGITVIRMEHPEKPKFGRWMPYDPGLPTEDNTFLSTDCWHEQCPVKRCPLPEYVPDVAAGAAAPLQLTNWKIRAIKLAVLLETRGYLTRHDFKHLGVDHSRWITRGNEWLLPSERGFVRARYMPDFKAQHPVVYAQVEADIAKWAPKTGTNNNGQMSMVV